MFFSIAHVCQLVCKHLNELYGNATFSECTFYLFSCTSLLYVYLNVDYLFVYAVHLSVWILAVLSYRLLWCKVQFGIVYPDIACV